MPDPTKLPLFVGTSHLGRVVEWPTASDVESFRYLDRLSDLGLTAFDLARSYQAGGTERLFGRWLKRRGSRDDLFLASKGGHPLPILAPHRLHKRALEDDLHSSLKSLGTDYIDLYFLHRDDSEPPLEEIAATLASFVQTGKVRELGLSNWHHHRFEALKKCLLAEGGPAPTWTSPQFSPFPWTRPAWPGCVSITSDAEALSYYQNAGVQVLAWSPLGSGFLSKNSQDTVYASKDNQVRKQRLTDWAKAHDVSAPVAALIWLRSWPVSVTPSVAARNPQHFEAHLAAKDLKMSAEERDFIFNINS